jgi:hypothetical protein
MAVVGLVGVRVGFDWFLILLLDIKLSMTQKMIQKTAAFNGTGGLNKAFWALISNKS